MPAYEADDGPVSDETLSALKARVPQDRYKTIVSVGKTHEALMAELRPERRARVEARAAELIAEENP